MSVSCEEGDKMDDHIERQIVIRTYLIFLVGLINFTYKSTAYIHLVYFEYFRDLEMVDDYVLEYSFKLHIYVVI